MKKILGYVVAFTVGTLFSGSAAWAATNYVQASKQSSSFELDGVPTGKPPALVYGGTTYVQLWSVEQMMTQLGFQPSWDGQNFRVSTLNPYLLPGKNNDNDAVKYDIAESISNIQQWQSYFDLTSQINPHETDTQFQNKIRVFIQNSTNDVQALSSDSPSDPQLQTLLKTYVQIVQQYAKSFQDALDGHVNKDIPLLDQAISEMTNAQKTYANFAVTWNAYLWNDGSNTSGTSLSSLNGKGPVQTMKGLLPEDHVRNGET